MLTTRERINPHRSLNSFPLTECANYGQLCTLRFLFWLQYTLASRLRIIGSRFLDRASYVSSLGTAPVHTYFLEEPVLQAQDEFSHQDSQKQQYFGFLSVAHVQLGFHPSSTFELHFLQL